MQPVECLHCGTKVVPTEKGNCPSCGGSFREIPPHVDPRQIPTLIDAEAAQLCPLLAEALGTTYHGPRLVRLSEERGVLVDFACEAGSYRATFGKDRMEVYPVDFPGGALLQETPLMSADIPQGLSALKACGAPRPQPSAPARGKPWWKFW